MNAKKLTILTVITIMVVIAAIFLTQKKTERLESKAVFPNLMSSLEEVTEIDIATKNDKFTMLRSGEQWLLKEKHNYPVAAEKVRSMLLGLADLTTLEAKTANPSLYSKLAVEDVSDKDAKSILLTLKKSKGETVASLIVGRSQTAKGDSTLSELYVRKPDDKQTWLTQGFLQVERTPLDWVEKKVLDIDGKRIHKVNITQPAGQKLSIFKDKVEEENFQLAEMPVQAKLKAPYELGQIANVLSYLNINDVTGEKDVNFDEKSTYHGVFTTFDGLEVSMTTTEKEGKYYAKFATALVPAVTTKKVETEKKEGEKKDEKATAKEKKDEDKLKTAEEVKKEAETLKTKFSGWVFELPKYKAEVLAKKHEDLITTEKEEKAAKAAKEKLVPDRDKSPSPLVEFGNATTTEDNATTEDGAATTEDNADPTEDEK
jgi:hypothetical protein